MKRQNLLSDVMITCAVVYLSDQVLMCGSSVKVPPDRDSQQDEINTKFSALNYSDQTCLALLSGKAFWRTITLKF